MRRFAANRRRLVDDEPLRLPLPVERKLLEIEQRLAIECGGLRPRDNRLDDARRELLLRV